MTVKKNDRIIALLEVSGNIVSCLGEGIYAGRFPLPSYAGGFNFGQENPKLILDNGQIVWGCECWWGLKDLVIKKYPKDKFKWKNVNIDHYRDATKKTIENNII